MMAVCFGRIFVSRQTIFLSTVRYFANSSSALFKVGDEVEVRRVVSMRDVQQFARITGDTNPIHLDEKFAKKTQVGQLIVHGVILNGIISAIHGTKLPGPGCMIMSQSLKYPAPLFPGEEVLAHIQVTGLRHSIMTCHVTCTAVQRSKVVLSGETKLLVPQNLDN
ncbi:hydroxyacyl-thioester dehydratase type 2, mitochondrial-like [Oculina patagonica]